MSEKLTHDSLKPLISTLPDHVREGYFEWRRNRAAHYRSVAERARGGSGLWLGYHSPEFVAECLQKLLALHAEVGKRLAMFSGDAANIDSTTAHDVVYMSRKPPE